MGNHQSSPLQACLTSVCAGQAECVAFPGQALYDALWVRPYNLDVPLTPAAVIRPRTAEMVAAAVRCAARYGHPVQARSGGHSYGNYGLGGESGAVSIDLVRLDDFAMDKDTWTASFGSGLRLGQLDKKLHENGQRAVPHGTCPGVGVGGQAVVGGLGPSSRMWGNMIDHMVEVEAVTATGNIVRASESQNADLFWALRGAGPAFAIITKMWLRTHPAPRNVVEYTYDVKLGRPNDSRPLFDQWMALAGDPKLDRRFSTLFVMHPLGAIVTGTFYGTRDELTRSGILDRLPAHGVLRLRDWLASVVHNFESLLLSLADVPTHFYSRSLGLRQQDMLDAGETDALFARLKAGGAPMVLIFNTEGGAVADGAADKTSYPHRDKLVIYQSYLINLLGPVPGAQKAYLDDVHQLIKRDTTPSASTYAGYVDRGPNRTEAQLAYWGDFVPRLQRIKQDWDPSDVFRNPQSIQPAGAL